MIRFATSGIMAKAWSIEVHGIGLYDRTPWLALALLPFSRRGIWSALRSMTSLEKALRDFAQFAARLKDDDKSEALTFLIQSLWDCG